MTHRLEPLQPGLELPPEPAAGLATELSQAVVTRVQHSAADIAALAQAMSLDPARVRVELSYLLALVTRFCISTAVADTDAEARLLAAFESSLLALDELALTARGLRVRHVAYGDALAHPHPDLGRAYSVGRVFARYCDASHEVAVIDFAARTYMNQLPPMLGRLRSVTVV